MSSPLYQLVPNSTIHDSPGIDISLPLEKLEYLVRAKQADGKQYKEQLDQYINESHETDAAVHSENHLRWYEKTAQLILTYLARYGTDKAHERMTKFICKEMDKVIYSN